MSLTFNFVMTFSEFLSLIEPIVLERKLQLFYSDNVMIKAVSISELKDFINEIPYKMLLLTKTKKLKSNETMNSLLERASDELVEINNIRETETEIEIKSLRCINKRSKSKDLLNQLKIAVEEKCKTGVLLNGILYENILYSKDNIHKKIFYDLEKKSIVATIP